MFLIVLSIILVYLVLIILTGVLRQLVFFIEPIFRGLNYAQWIISNPIRVLWKTSYSNKPRGFFIALTYTGISTLWFIFSYIINTPIRVILSLYYDIILFSAVSFSDNIQEFLYPKRGKLGHIKGWSFFSLYIVSFPIRFVRMLVDTGLYVLDSILMCGVSIVFPSLVMLHGTKFREAGTKITQSGDWLVGHGNYAGTGIYFGLNKKTAEHYAPSDNEKSIIIARVTLTFCKTISTLKEEDRDLVGLGSGGDELARKVKGFYSSVEHWRNLGWWEYCILQPGKKGDYVSSWRIRLVALINNDKIVRTYGGFSHYTLGTGLIAGIVSWMVIFSFLVLLNQ